jgi:hypothetical protein
MPAYKDVLAAVRTTLSPGNSSFPNRFILLLGVVVDEDDAAAADAVANALAYKLVVATFKNANRYKLPSMKVVAGPNAANCDALDNPPAAAAAAAAAVQLPLRPMKEVSTSDNNGPEIHNAKHGK